MCLRKRCSGNDWVSVILEPHRESFKLRKDISSPQRWRYYNPLNAGCYSPPPWESNVAKFIFCFKIGKKLTMRWNLFRWFCVSQYENYLLISFTITVLSSATWITMELHSSYTASFLKWTHEVQYMTLIQLVPIKRVLLEKLTVPQLIQKFPTSHGPRVHYHIYNSLPSVTTLKHMNPVHTLPSYFINAYINIILLCIPRSSKQSSSFRSAWIPSLPQTCKMPHLNHHTLTQSQLKDIYPTAQSTSLCHTARTKFCLLPASYTTSPRQAKHH